MNSIRHVVSHPLLQFSAVGILIYGLYVLLAPTQKEQIIVDDQTISALIQQQEALQITAVGEEQKKSLIESYIDDEVLLREAYKRGLVENNTQVRKQLLNSMRFSLTEQVPAPSYQQLKAFYEERKHEYASDSAWSIEQVFFSFDSEKFPADTIGFVTTLANAVNPLAYGEFNMVGNRLSKSTFADLARIFGKPFALRVTQLEPDQWIGPITSIQGLHYVKLTATHPPEIPTFEQMERYLANDYEFQMMREQQQERIDELKQQYEIVIED